MTPITPENMQALTDAIARKDHEAIYRILQATKTQPEVQVPSGDNRIDRAIAEDSLRVEKTMDADPGPEKQK